MVSMLQGLTLLDFSSMGPGPRCTRLLADYGMRVIKVRPPRGTRMMEAPWYTYSANRGIPQIHVDLKTEAGGDLVRRLLPHVDAVVESFRPGVVGRLGIGYDDVRTVNQAVVYCSVSGFGQHGPYADWPAHDVNWLALTGFLGGGSRADQEAPPLPGATVADAVGGFSTATAILSALIRKISTGEGTFLDSTVIDGVLRTMHAVIDQHLAEEGADDTSTPGMLTGASACYNVYRAADGRWLAVGAIESHFWAALCQGLNLEHLIADQHDPARQAELKDEIARAFAARPRDEWIAALGPVACVTPVNTVEEALRDPHLRSRPLTVEVGVGDRRVRQMAPRLAVPDPDDLLEQPAGPTPAAAVDDLLETLGIPRHETADLRAAEVLA